MRFESALLRSTFVYARSLTPGARNRAAERTMGNKARAFHTRGLPMWTGVHAAAVSYTAYAAARIPRLAPPTMAAATGNGSSPWKRRDEKGRKKERERRRALYISTSMRAETSPYFSIQSSALLPLHTVSEASYPAPPPTPAVSVPRAWIW